MYHLARDHLFRAVLFSTDDAFSAIVEALQHAKTDGTRTNFVKTLSLLNKIQVESCALISLLVKSLQTLRTTTFEAMPSEAMRANISALLLQLANVDLLVPTDDACSALLEALQHAETCDTRDTVLTAICSFSLTGRGLSDAGSALISRLVSSLKTANASQSDAMRAKVATAMYHLARDHLFRAVLISTDGAFSALVEALQHAKTDGTRTIVLRAIRLFPHNQDAIFALILQLARSLKTADSCAMRANVANFICFFVDDPVSRVALSASDDACSALLALHHAETDSTRSSVLRAMLLFSQNNDSRRCHPSRRPTKPAKCEV
jgi:cellobiose-specific phosphotransferase system component IIA